MKFVKHGYENLNENSKSLKKSIVFSFSSWPSKSRKPRIYSAPSSLSRNTYTHVCETNDWIRVKLRNYLWTGPQLVPFYILMSVWFQLFTIGCLINMYVYPTYFVSRYCDFFEKIELDVFSNISGKQNCEFQTLLSKQFSVIS